MMGGGRLPQDFLGKLSLSLTMRVKVRELRAALRAVGERRTQRIVTLSFRKNELLVISESDDYVLYQSLFAVGDKNSAVRVWKADVMQAISDLDGKDYIEIQPLSDNHIRINDVSVSVVEFTEPARPRLIPAAPPSFALTAAQWRQVCERVAFCAGEAAARPQLRGVHVEARLVGAKFTATDAHRLVVWELGAASRAGSALVPTGVWSMLSRLSKKLHEEEEIAVFFEKDYTYFYHESFDLLAKKPEAQFPDISHLFAQRDEFVVRLNRESLQNAIRKAIDSAKTVFKPVGLYFHPGQCVVALPEDGGGIVQDILQCDAGFSERIAFDAKKLISLLERLGGDIVEMRIDAQNASVRHVVLRGEGDGYVAVIMPILPQ